MKYILLIFIACLISGCIVSRSNQRSILKIINSFEDEYGKVMIVAHRANLIDTLPENSLEGVLACIEHGIDIVEIDLQKTKDNVLIVMHDDRLNRMTNGNGNVSDYTWEEISHLYLRIKSFGPKSEYKIPSFEQVLDVSKNKILINVDKAFWYLRDVYELAEQKGMSSQIILKSYDPKKDIEKQLSEYPHHYFMPILSEGGFNNIANAEAFLNTNNSPSPFAYELIFDEMTDSLASPYFISLLKENGARIWINTLSDGLCGGYSDNSNAEENWQYLIDQGFNIIQTDRGLILREFLDRTNQ